jgi:SAM-dependent methyltransferase
MSLTGSFTRGKGMLEPLLAQWRANKANGLIPDSLRTGRILDIGCGTYPYFLSHTHFKEKMAIDQLPPANVGEEIKWHVVDLNSAPELPFENGHFNAITMLALVEHLNPQSMSQIFKECYRILAPDGILIATTPSAWSDPILKFMARVSLVSKEEIDEHVFAYTLPLLGWYYGQGGFAMDKVRFGYFEMGLNMWAAGTK